MIRRISITRLAWDDLRLSAEWIERDNSAAAIRFLDSCETIFRLIATQPEIGVLGRYRNPTLHDVRILPVPGFERYLVFYHVESDEIQILRMRHSAQRSPRP